MFAATCHAGLSARRWLQTYIFRASLVVAALQGSVSQLVDKRCFVGKLHSRRVCVPHALSRFQRRLHRCCWIKEATLQQHGCDTRSALCRFLRARDFDLKAATKMYNEYCTVVRP